ncbi:uncharacterized protein J8A68_001039 [[Candida] subhashii]|uniref:Uncharacterized protein n=1 Tax=[Candida] subhashii TaxID=561895 RepID=A0A8J5QRH9_9ASCO|nr:uncharacterized protein J8A68_001039 [[Candida] subhashii]KAG7665351.1 hypothetical protein J8A68_001039 [[Candida] subhashii]
MSEKGYKPFGHNYTRSDIREYIRGCYAWFFREIEYIRPVQQEMDYKYTLLERLHPGFTDALKAALFPLNLNSFNGVDGFQFKEGEALVYFLEEFVTEIYKTFLSHNRQSDYKLSEHLIGDYMGSIEPHDSALHKANSKHSHEHGKGHFKHVHDHNSHTKHPRPHTPHPHEFSTPAHGQTPHTHEPSPLAHENNDEHSSHTNDDDKK